MRRLAWLLPAAVLAMAACTNGDELQGNQTSRLTVLLKDAPGDIQEAVVTIEQIYLQGGENDSTGNDSTSTKGRVVLRSEPVTTDLLTLANDVQTLVDSAGIPSGHYGQLRFVISGAYIKVETTGGSQVFSTPNYSEAPAQVDGLLMCPSCSQSGIKVNLDHSIDLSGGAQTLLVDFDVSESFGHEAGNGLLWVMHPSLKGSELEASARSATRTLRSIAR